MRPAHLHSSEPYTWPVPRQGIQVPPTPSAGAAVIKGSKLAGPLRARPEDATTATLCGSRFGRSSLLTRVTQRRTTGSRRATRATQCSAHPPLAPHTVPTQGTAQSNSRHAQRSAHPPLAPHSLRTHPTRATHCAPHTPHSRHTQCPHKAPHRATRATHRRAQFAPRQCSA